MKNKINYVALTAVLTIVCAAACYAATPVIVLKPKRGYASEFVKGLAYASDGADSYDVMNTDGCYIFENLDDVWLRSNGLVEIFDGNGKAAFLNSANKADDTASADFIYDDYTFRVEKGNCIQRYKNKSLDSDESSDLIAVSKNHLFGYINSLGKEVIPCTFDYAEGFHNGFARVSAEGTLSKYGTYTNGKYNYIDENGKLLLDEWYWIEERFNCGLGRVSNGGLWYAVKPDGSLIDFHGCGYLCTNGKYCIIYNDSGYGIADMSGNILIPCKYDNIEFLGDNFIISHNYVIDIHEKVLYKYSNDISINALYGGKGKFAFVSTVASDSPSGIPHTNYGLLNSDVVSILPVVYDQILDLGEGVLFARNHIGNFLFDYKGKQLCKLNGNEPTPFSCGLSRIRDFDTMTLCYISNPLDVTVTVDGKYVYSDAKCIIENGRTLVPARAVFEKMGAVVSWDESTQTVSVSSLKHKAVLKINSDKMTVDGEETVLDVPARIVGSRTLIPLRAVSQALGADADWDEDSRHCIIKTSLDD